MTPEAAHLTAEARETLSLSNEKRIARIRRQRWIGHTRARQVLARMEELLEYPRTHRMPNMLLVGDTNSGKTMIVTRFAKSRGPRELDGAERASVPVLYVQAPPVPDERRFYTTILEALFVAHRTSERAATAQFKVLHALRGAQVQMLIIDEIHHVLAGHLARQRQFLNVVKYLGNELQIPFVAVGIQDAVRAIQTDPQLGNRFEPVFLPRWEMGREYLMLLASFESMIPLRLPSHLEQPRLSQMLLGLSEGSIGELAGLLGAAAIHAVRTDREKIDEEVLKAIEWTPPSQRRRRGECYG